MVAVLQANLCPEGMSGADFYSLAARTTTNAIARLIKDIDSGKISEKDANIVLEMSDFTEAVRDLNPSVSEQEMQRYGAIKDVL